MFGNHQVATDHLLPSLMSIFVDIEFTGESMEFEDKFRKFSIQYTSVPDTGVCKGGFCAYDKV